MIHSMNFHPISEGRACESPISQTISETRGLVPPSFMVPILAGPRLCPWFTLLCLSVAATCFAAPQTSNRGALAEFASSPLPPHAILDLVGRRQDRNSVGHGRNLALFAGNPSRYFFATHSLGNIFSATDGSIVQWFPDHVLLDPSKPGRDNPADAVIERRRVCVTKEDVVVCQVLLTNSSDHAVSHLLEISGDCRQSFDWQERPGGSKSTEHVGRNVLVRDSGVYPNRFKNGLSFLVGGNTAPKEIVTEPPGTYRMAFEVRIPARGTSQIILACAVDPDATRAQWNLAGVLRQTEPVAENRKDWAKFFDEEIPRFTCSDRGLTELYAYRWYLLRFSTIGSQVGLFRFPIVLEGRQAYQTAGCFSAPFMAFDLNWAPDPAVGFHQIAGLASVSYEDGRFPWRASPRTNKVALQHESATGLSLLPLAAWKHYLIHGDLDLLRQVYPAMKKNLLWWIQERDPNNDDHR